MPILPAEVTAEFTVTAAASTGMDADPVRAAREAAVAAGIALDSGPTSTGLAGTREEVMSALAAVVDATLTAGEATIEVRIQVRPTQRTTTQ